MVITGTVFEAGRHLLSAGAQDYIGKDWTTPGSLVRAIENAIERYTLLVAHRRAEDLLRISYERHRALFDSIESGYAVIEMVLDADGVVVDAHYLQVNPAFARQSGLHSAEGQSIRNLLPGIEARWFEACWVVVQTGESVREERYSEDLQRWFDVYAFRLGEPKAQQFAVLFNDITERKQAELALMAASAEAARANEAKSEFLLRMSHELRSPLSAMLGFAQLIHAGTPPLTSTQAERVEQILRAGWYLLDLINEILDLTSIESGMTQVMSEAVSLTELMDDCRAIFEPQAQSRSISVSFPRFEQPCFVQADLTRTKQVLINLLTNAIKYNRSAGRVNVRCCVTLGQRVRVTVEDTGQGLSTAQMQHLFEPFNRLGKESGGEPGTGIGLVICKRLIELMGGQIGVDSTVGVGSCFWFELAVAAAYSAADDTNEAARQCQ